MGSVPSSSALSGAEVPSTPSLAVSQAAGAVNCESSVIFIHSFLVALAWVHFGTKVFDSCRCACPSAVGFYTKAACPSAVVFYTSFLDVRAPRRWGFTPGLRASRRWGFTPAFSMCVPLGGGVLHLAASVCVPLGCGVLHILSRAASVCVPLSSCFGGVRVPRRWVLSLAASVCVPLSGGVLHQLSRAACPSAVWFYTSFLDVRAPRRWDFTPASSVCVPLGGGVASVCVPLRLWGFIPAFSCCVGVRTPRLLLLRRCACPSAVGFYTSFILLRRCACPSAFSSLVRNPLRRWVHLFRELLMPRAVFLWVRSLLVPIPSSY